MPIMVSTKAMPENGASRAIFVVIVVSFRLNAPRRGAVLSVVRPVFPAAEAGVPRRLGSFVPRPCATPASCGTMSHAIHARGDARGGCRCGAGLVAVGGGVRRGGRRPTDAAALVLMAVAVLTTAGVGALIGVRVPGHVVGLVLAVAAFVYGTGSWRSSTHASSSSTTTRTAGGRMGGALGERQLGRRCSPASSPSRSSSPTAGSRRRGGGRSRGPRSVLTGTVVMGLFSSEPFDKPFQDVTNPLPALPGGPRAAAARASCSVWRRCVVAAGIAVRRRFVRAVQPERQQLLWLA